VWFLTVYGVTLVVTESKLFAPVRAAAAARVAWLGTLLACPMCFGFWCGAALSLGGWSPSAAVVPAWPRLLRALADGAAAAGAAWALAALVGLLLEIRYSLETWREAAERRRAPEPDEDER
jgi:hypothetical protein